MFLVYFFVPQGDLVKNLLLSVCMYPLKKGEEESSILLVFISSTKCKWISQTCEATEACETLFIKCFGSQSLTG